MKDTHGKDHNINNIISLQTLGCVSMRELYLHDPVSAVLVEPKPAICWDTRDLQVYATDQKSASQ